MPTLRYINPDAASKEVYVFAVSSMPLTYGATYTVALPLVAGLLSTGEWERTATLPEIAPRVSGRRSKPE